MCHYWLYLGMLPKNADQWLSMTNSAPLFNGESALSFLLKNPGKHLPQLLDYLGSSQKTENKAR